MAISKENDAASSLPADVDHHFIPQSVLDIESGRRTNALPWRGQFSPEFVSALLERLSPSGLIVDPFCGSGTTLGEAARIGLSSFGLEVNAAAFMLARVHQLAEDSPSERAASFARVSTMMAQYAYEGNVQELRDKVIAIRDSRDAILAKAMFLLTLGNGLSLSTRSYERAHASVDRLLREMTGVVESVRIQLGDARSLPIRDGESGMVFTSPPYVNVFNYHQNYRKAVELLGYDVLPPARSEIGSNRKFRQNRFMTVVQYAQDTALALNEAMRVLRPGGPLVWVVGRESNVRGVAICNSKIAFTLAAKLPGLAFERRLERKFRSRYGALVYEDILIFRRVSGGGYPPARLAEYGRTVGTQVLNELLEVLDGPVAVEVCEARDAAARVSPSPLMAR